MSLVRRLLIRNSRLSPLLISVALTTATTTSNTAACFTKQRRMAPSSLHSQSTAQSARYLSTPSSSNSNSNSSSSSIPHNKMDLSTWKDGKAIAIPKCVMPLTYDSHKGSSGRIGVLGGSAQYTGAPYYAAMASLKAGADLAYVFCAEEACLPIKSYSPELMVAPVYSANEFDEYTAEENIDKSDDGQMLALIDGMVKKVTSKLDNLHALVIGPGMGRCPLVCEATARIIKYAKTKKLALILDADALWMLAQPQYRSLLEDYEGAPVILTPNVIEYNRLFSNVIQSSSSQFPLQYTTIVKKGQCDVILQNEKKVMTCQEKGGKKRSGGIGDVLAGTLGTLTAWNVILSQDGNNSKHNKNDLLALSCWSACCFVKRATELAFEDKKRSMTAPDVLEHLGPAIDEMTTG